MSYTKIEILLKCEAIKVFVRFTVGMDDKTNERKSVCARACVCACVIERGREKNRESSRSDQSRSSEQENCFRDFRNTP